MILDFISNHDGLNWDKEEVFNITEFHLNLDLDLCRNVEKNILLTTKLIQLKRMIYQTIRDLQ